MAQLMGGGEFSAREEWLPKDHPERIAWEKQQIVAREQYLRAKAKEFHDIYEKLAPQFGYETRPDTKQFNPESPNGQLMIAVMKEMGL